MTSHLPSHLEIHKENRDTRDNNGVLGSDWRTQLKRYEVTETQINRIEDSIPIWYQIIFSGQAHVWVAKPNGGKTAMAIQAAADLARCGYEVFYFQLDSGGPDLKNLYEHAFHHNYSLISTLREGTSDKDIVEALESAIVEGEHSNSVFILDTLKKFVDVNSKQKAPEFYALLRRFTQRGGTVLSLAHANKYNDNDDKIIPDGVMDLVNDADNVAILQGLHTPEKLTISTNHSPSVGGKTRAKIVEASFELDKATYQITPVDFVNTQDELNRVEMEARDMNILLKIRNILSTNEWLNQTTLLEELNRQSVSVRKARAVLNAEEYLNKYWRLERGINNARLYSAMPDQTVQTVQTETGSNKSMWLT